MSRYRRARIEGGTYFFTVALADRSTDLLMKHVDHLRRVYQTIQRRLPFETVAICILPDHLHAVWSLPAGDADFPRRWNLIKGGFSRGLATAEMLSPSKLAKREKTDLARHIDYIHFNPVKHGLVSRVRDWPHSSFHKHVSRGVLPVDWGGDIREIAGTFGE